MANKNDVSIWVTVTVCDAVSEFEGNAQSAITIPAPFLKHLDFEKMQDLSKEVMMDAVRQFCEKNNIK